MFTLLLLAACGQGNTVVTDPGYDLDGDGIPDDVDTDNGNTDETDVAYFVAGKTATWNSSTHKVEDIRDLEDVWFSVNDPDGTCGLTEAQLDIAVGNWTVGYSYVMGDFTFTGDVTENMGDSTDFTGELDTVAGLEGTKLSCYTSDGDKTFTTVFEDLDGDPTNIEADDIAAGNGAFRANGPLLTKDSDNVAILTENGLYYAGHNSNVGDFYIECDFVE